VTSELSCPDQATTTAAAAAAAAAGGEGSDVGLRHSTLHRHSQFVMETIGAAVESLDFDDPTVFINILVALGQIHCTYDVQQHHMPVSDSNQHAVAAVAEY